MLKYSLTVATLLIVFSNAFQLPAQNSRNSEQGPWLSEVEQGITRYGLVPPFAEVGHSNSFDVSADGQTIAFASGIIKLWDLDENKVREDIKSSGGANFIEYSPDGLRLYVSSWGHQGSPLRILNAITGEEELGIKPKLDQSETENSNTQGLVVDEDGEAAVVKQTEQHFNIQGLAISPNDDRVALHDGYRVLVYDSNNGEKLSEFKTGDNYTQRLVFIEDGEKLLASNGDIYSCETGEKTGTWPQKIFGQWSQSVSVNPKNSNQIAASVWNSGVVLYDLESEEKTKLETDKGARHYSVIAFSGNGKLLAAASQVYNATGNVKGQSTIYVWDVRSGKLKNKFEHHSRHQAVLKFSANGEKLYSKSHNQIGITEWDLSEKEAKSDPQGHTSPIQKLQFSPDGDTIFTSSYGGGSIIFDLDSGEPVKKLQMQQVQHFTTSRDGRFMVAAANYQTMSIFDRKSERTKQVTVKSYQQPSLISRLGRMVTGKQDGYSYEQYSINHICIADDDEHVWLASRGQRHFRVEKFSMPAGKSEERFRFKMSDFWEMPSQTDANGNVVHTHSQLQWQADTVCVSNDGELMAIANDNKEIFVVDVATGDIVQELGKIGGGHTTKLKFIDGSQRLLVFANGELNTFDPRSGEKMGKKVSAGSQNFALQMAISHDESRMAMMHYDKSPTLKIIDLDSMEEVFSRKAEEFHSGLAISNDGQKVAMAKNNCQFDVWDLDELK